MNDYLISGIQQMGVGVEDFSKAWKWYINMFQMNVRILEDDTVAERMLPYTGGKAQKRHACIAVNLQGAAALRFGSIRSASRCQRLSKWPWATWASSPPR